LETQKYELECARQEEIAYADYDVPCLHVKDVLGADEHHQAHVEEVD